MLNVTVDCCCSSILLLFFLSDIKYAASPGQLSLTKDLLDLKEPVLTKRKLGCFYLRMKVVKSNSDAAGSDSDLETIKQVGCSV